MPTQPKARKPRQAPATAPQAAEDPLADLRDHDDAPGLPVPPQEAPPEVQAETEDPLFHAVFEAIGAASMCWEDVEAAGVFNSERAKVIGDDLYAAIHAARPLAPDSTAEDARAEVVAAFHADTVAKGFLHKGGACGCRYIAGLAVRTIVPTSPQE